MLPHPIGVLVRFFMIRINSWKFTRDDLIYDQISRIRLFPLGIAWDFISTLPFTANMQYNYNDYHTTDKFNKMNVLLISYSCKEQRWCELTWHDINHCYSKARTQRHYLVFSTRDNPWLLQSSMYSCRPYWCSASQYSFMWLLDSTSSLEKSSFHLEPDLSDWW